MGFFKLTPTRSQVDKSGSVIADIDAIDDSPVYFKFNGKAHEIRPTSTREFLKVAEIFSKMNAISTKENTMEELVDVYHELISTLCDSISRDDILSMSQNQVAAVLQLIIDHVLGRVQKKNLNPVPQISKS